MKDILNAELDNIAELVVKRLTDSMPRFMWSRRSIVVTSSRCGCRRKGLSLLGGQCGISFIPSNMNGLMNEHT